MATANVPITSLPEATAPSASDYLILQGSSTQKIKWSALLNKIYPVGSIYQSTSSTSPASFLGGTWERIKDRFLLAAGDTYSAGATGGEATHKLTTSELPKVSGYITGVAVYTPNQTHGVLSAAAESAGSVIQGDYSGSKKYGQLTLSFGSDGTHNNMPPYLTVYVWKRTA